MHRNPKVQIRCKYVRDIKILQAYQRKRGGKVVISKTSLPEMTSNKFLSAYTEKTRKLLMQLSIAAVNYTLVKLYTGFLCANCFAARHLKRRYGEVAVFVPGHNLVDALIPECYHDT